MQLALPPPKLAEDVVPFAIEGDLPSMPEEQYPTMMIEGVLR